MECKICYELIEDNITYNNAVLPYCIDCLNLLLNNTWYNYIKQIKTIDCEKSLKNLIHEGIPIYFRDTQVENNLVIKNFIYQQNVISGKLKASLSKDNIILLNSQLKLAINNADYLSSLYNFNL